jgi:hypothetical protein
MLACMASAPAVPVEELGLLGLRVLARAGGRDVFADSGNGVATCLGPEPASSMRVAKVPLEIMSML